MYDDDEEIKRKRRNLILIIVVIAIIIVILLFLLIAKTNGSGKSAKDTDMKCTLEIVSGEKDRQGNYTGNVVVGFAEVTPESSVVKKQVGVKESNSNKDTYTVKKKGTTTVKGFIYNKKGQVATCSTSVTIVSDSGNCKLSVVDGTPGDLNWYTSDVVVRLDTVDTGNLTIKKYYITKKDEKAPDKNLDTFTVTEEGKTELVGTLEYSNGNKSTCNITINKDSVKPTCTLKVVSGEANGNGTYSGDVKVAIENATDDTSGIETKGVGKGNSLDGEEYSIKEFKTEEVKGYVKDKAGNENTCAIKVTKAEKPSAPPAPAPNPNGGVGAPGATVVNNTNWMCQLTVSGSQKNGVYYGAVIVGFSKINAGLSSSSITVGDKTAADYVAIPQPTKATQYTANARVTYSGGGSATCSITFTIDPTVDAVNYFKRNAQVGQVVNYNPGTWGNTVNMPTKDGELGGYYQGRSKNSSVSCKDAQGTSPFSGWRIAYVGDKIKLIHAGVPICMHHVAGQNYSYALSKINDHRNAAVFIDNNVAEDAYYMTDQDFSNFTRKKEPPQVPIAVGEFYYLGGNYTPTQTAVSYLEATGGNHPQYMAGTLGLRPIVTLKSNVGARSDGNAWQLVVVNRATDNDDDSKLSNRINDRLSSAIAEVESLYY